MNDMASLIGRVLLALLFIQAGIGKISGYEGAGGYMQTFGIPAALLPAVIALEVVGGAMVMLGFFSRFAALALALFTLAAAAIFHNMFADQSQSIMFMKNVAVAGGLLMVFAQGPGRFSINNR